MRLRKLKFGKFFINGFVVSVMVAMLSPISFADLAEKDSGVKKIGILVPISLPAMDQIVAGYENELKKEYVGPGVSKIEFIVKNAEGSASIQQAILQEFLAKNVDVIAPIGTDATEMAIHMDAVSHQNIPIVAIAAEMPKNSLNATNILDEVSISTQINFIHQAMPNLKKMTLIYSADDRIFAEVKQAKDAAAKAHIQLQTFMIQTLPDLYAVHDHIDADSQAIFILKDELVVSGIRTLVQQAERRHIPVIASDDGSVSNGAAFALGVRESDIGKYAAFSTIKILQGTNAAEIPEVRMTKYTVFVNEKSAKLQGLNVNALQSVVKKEGLAYDALS